MKIIQHLMAITILIVSMNSACVRASEEAEPPREWLVFVENLKKEMLSKGISEATIDKAYGSKTYYHVRPKMVEQDKKQAEFILTSSTYLNRLVNADRIATARQKYTELKKKYHFIEERYGVPLTYLTAFWAIETNFGKNKGQYHLIDTLTNLSYRNRRSEFFKKELYNVLQIMDRYDLENDKMKGSWAGAMGHFQFMPSTYNAYAVDVDNDGMADIWDSFDDALGSAANYLSSLGWKADQAWGCSATLPWNFDYRLTGSKNPKTVREWIDLGVRTADGKKPDYDPEAKATVIMPDGRKGPVYLTLGNFRRIMIWNRSDNYALAVGLLADYISSDRAYQPVRSERQYALTDKDVLKVQAFANKVLHLNLKEDGKLGPQTKDAVKKIQMKAKMPVDGYPDYRLLSKIDHYDPKIGFEIPVQSGRKRRTDGK